MDYMEGVKALFCGMTTVFAVLILISIVISLFKYIKPTEKSIPKSDNVIAPVAQTTVVVKKEDDLELVAVITATIAASLNTTADRLRVTSFRRVNAKNKLNCR
ncbi:MAG: hypothetical protein CVU84_03295 [Firmicutes bacterium HGW-Firmicutes-1]|jgi:sodium pump decarboxylase gamma subunit|nr:MAG: hypothetical protein CVU84_03295 [Firmicutes bacterium HGW-Firmicutes-1]